LNWSVWEKEFYGIFYGIQLFKDLLDNRPFILMTDHKNLTYLRWKFYLQAKDFYSCHVPGKKVHQGVPDALSRLCKNNMLAKPDKENQQGRTVIMSALKPEQSLPDMIYDKVAAVHNSSKDH